MHVRTTICIFGLVDCIKKGRCVLRPNLTAYSNAAKFKNGLVCSDYDMHVRTILSKMQPSFNNGASWTVTRFTHSNNYEHGTD